MKIVPLALVLLCGVFGTIQAEDTFPLVAKAQDGAEVILNQQAPNSPLYTVKLLNFPADEVVTVISKSEQAQVVFTVQIAPQSDRTYTISPAVVGETGGPATLIIERPSGEKIVLDYTWGTQTPH